MGYAPVEMMYMQHLWRQHQDPHRVAAVAWKAQVLREEPELQQELMEEAVDILAAHHGEAHPEVAKKKVELAAIRSSMGACNDANRLLEEALEVLEERFGAHDPEVVRVRKSLAGLRCQMSDYKAARRQYEEVLEIEELYLDGQHLTAASAACLATTKNNLGNVCGYLGDHRTGKRYVKEALELARDNFQRHHPVVVATRRNYDRFVSMEYK